MDHCLKSITIIYRIFRDYGNIPGLDIAFVKNGFVYHTDADTPDRIPDGSIQRSGENVFAVIVKLTTTSDSKLGIGANNDSPPVFFDIFGLIVISYPQWIGSLINFGIIGIAVIAIYIDVSEFSKKTDISKVK